MTTKERLSWLSIFALLTLFSSGRWALAPVAWLLPALGLYLIHRTGAWRGLALLVAAGYLPLALGWSGVLPLPLPLFAIFMLVTALIGSLPYLADRLLVRRPGGRFATTLVFPITATAVEYLMMADGPLGSFGAQAYSQAALAPLVQLTSIGGMWAITFLVSWGASVIHWAVSRVERGESPRSGLAIAGAVVAVVLLAGGARLLTAPQPSESVTIAAVTAAHVEMGELMALRANDKAAFRAQTRAQHDLYLARTATAAATGAQIVLWPELAGIGMADDVAALVAGGQALADEHDLYLAMPLFVIEAEGAPVNKVVVADPDGEIVLEHVKYGGNLLEGTVAGSRELQTVETPFGTLSVVICWDTDYPTVMQQAGREGVDILLSPAYVWPEIARLHGEMATFRAIENGVTLVRHSDNGLSLVSDGYGRVTARESFVGQSEALFVAEAPLMPVRTLYPRIGDLVGIGSAMALLMLMVVAVTRSVRRRLAARRVPATA